MNDYHTTVLLKEAIDGLNIRAGDKYIDATLGGGGHAGRIIEKGGIVLGIDVDEEAIEYVRSKFENSKNLFLVKGNFKEIDKLAKDNGFEKIAGAVFDLGVSSHQLEIPERGFSFAKDATLDMRMDRDLSVKAIDLVNILSKKELYELFTKFGEERFARVISESIVGARQIEPIITTTELTEIIKSAVKIRDHKTNPATKAFQALRIVINDEVNNLKEGLENVLKIVKENGRIAVISFHSIEDRIVKNQFKKWSVQGVGNIVTKKPITPTTDEIENNKRSRSAKLRVFEKI